MCSGRYLHRAFILLTGLLDYCWSPLREETENWRLEKQAGDLQEGAVGESQNIGIVRAQARWLMPLNHLTGVKSSRLLACCRHIKSKQRWRVQLLNGMGRSETLVSSETLVFSTWDLRHSPLCYEGSWWSRMKKADLQFIPRAHPHPHLLWQSAHMDTHTHAYTRHSAALVLSA